MIEIDSDKLTNNVLVTLETIEGKSQLYANPAILPEFSPTSMFKAEAAYSKSILIQSDIIQSITGTGSKVV